MNNKKGFTLVELLAVIVMLGIIAFVAIPAVSSYLISSKNTTYSTYEKSMVDAAKNKIIECIAGNDQCELPDGETEQRISLGSLIDGGYIDNMKDPDGDNFCDANSYVT